MNILIIDIDSKIPNLALKKVERYHLDLGHEVMWNNPMWRSWADKIYVSCVFDYNKDKCVEWENDPKVLIGGSGYNLKTVLPPEIEVVNPKINIGFSSRGCIRHCDFCVVPIKEGKIRATGDLYSIWDGKSKDIVLLDNNILALPEHFELICYQLRQEKLKVDFNQGLDIRLLTKSNVRNLANISHEEYRFAFDNIATYPAVIRGIDLLREGGINRAFWYVYCDENFESALERLLILKRLGQRMFLMRDRKVAGIQKYDDLANWCNGQAIMQTNDIWDYLMSDRKKEVENYTATLEF